MKAIYVVSHNYKFIKNDIFFSLGDGFELIVLDVRTLFTSKYKNEDIGQNLKIPPEFKINPIKIDAIDEFIYFIKAQGKDSFFVKGYRFCWQDLYLDILLKKYGCKIVLFSANSYIENTQYAGRRSFFRRLSLLPKKGYKYVFGYFGTIASLFFRKIGLIPRYSVAFISSKADLKALMSHDYIDDFEFIHSNQYDNMPKSGILISEENIVFLAQNFPYDPFDLHRNGESAIDRSGYAQQLNNLLSMLEIKYKKEVIICAHPKYDLSCANVDFGHRKVFKDMTYEHIGKALLVVGHFSSAINYAVLIKKPIVLADVEVLKNNPWVRSNMLRYRNLLQLQMIRTEEDVACLELIVKEDKYDIFIKNYLSIYHPSSLSNKAIIFSYLKNKFL